MVIVEMRLKSFLKMGRKFGRRPVREILERVERRDGKAAEGACWFSDYADALFGGALSEGLFIGIEFRASNLH